MVEFTELFSSQLPRQREIRPGFCVDTGAPSSIILIKELRSLSIVFGTNLLRPRKPKKRIRFADSSFDFLGEVEITISTPYHIQTIIVKIDVVSDDVLELLGLDLLEFKSIIADTVMNRLEKKVILDKFENGLENIQRIISMD